MLTKEQLEAEIRDMERLLAEAEAFLARRTRARGARES